MPQMDLSQSTCTYSACEPFNINKETKVFTIYIYQRKKKIHDIFIKTY